jgi:hypothetical protein
MACESGHAPRIDIDPNGSVLLYVPDAQQGSPDIKQTCGTNQRAEEADPTSYRDGLRER